MWPAHEHTHDANKRLGGTHTHAGFCAKAHGAHVSHGRGSAWPQRELLATCSFETSCHEPFGVDDFLIP